VTRALSLITLLSVTASCAVGPNYKRPEVEVPDRYRAELTPEAAASFADLPWWEVFEDPALQALLTQSLADNRDLQIALQRSEQARQQVTATRSALLPQIGYGAQAQRSKYPINLVPSSRQRFNRFFAGLNSAWEIDLWGRIRRATQAARADMLASEANQRGVILSLVSQVSTLYFQLLELDAELLVAQEASSAFGDTLELFNRRYELGVSSKLAVARAAAAHADAQAWIPAIALQITAVENQLSVLQGGLPGAIQRGTPLAQQRLPKVPAGLPSALLERRPDVQSAEQGVIATNAQVGVAIGNFLPRVGLSALWGGASGDLSNLTKGSANVWNLAGELAGPIFQGGLLYSQYKAQQAAWEEARSRYEQTALVAFAEVSDALTARQRLGEKRIAEQERASQLRLAVRLSLARYEQGLSDYFEVLEAQQDLYPALMDLAETRFEELRSVIDLYAALGGGWELGVDWKRQGDSPGEAPAGEAHSDEASPPAS